MCGWELTGLHPVISTIFNPARPVTLVTCIVELLGKAPLLSEEE